MMLYEEMVSDAKLIDLTGEKARRDERRRSEPMTITRGRWEDMVAEVAKLSDLLNRLAKLAAGTQKRQTEMRADLIKAGAFKKESGLILPDRMQ